MTRTVRGIGVLVMAVGLAVAADTPAEYPVDEDALYEEIAEIQDAAGELSDRDASRAQEWIRRGVAAHDQRDYERALNSYTKAVEIAPTWALGYYERGLTLMTLGRSREALEDMIRCLALDPKEALAWVTRASLEDDLGYSDRALATYSELLELEPDNYMALVNKAITHLKRDEMEEADVLLHHAVETSPDQPSAYIHLASSARLRGYNYDEEAYLRKFLEVGTQDPRYPQVEKRLGELKATNLTLDPSHEHMDIEIAVMTSRMLWKTVKHREQNPEARGYRLTLAEEQDVLQSTLLGVWRARKEADSSVASPYYDFLLAIDDAGFFEEYVYTQKASEIGAEAAEWVEANPDRVQAFFDWARDRGFISSDDGPEENAPAASEARTESAVVEDEEAVVIGVEDLPALIMNAAMESDWTYEHLGERETGSTPTTERKRWRRFRFEGDDVADCDIDLRQSMQGAIRGTYDTFLLAARCFGPDDRQWADLQMVSRLGHRFEDRPFPLLADVRKRGKRRVAIGSSGTPGGLYYALTKAVWPREDVVRRVFDAERDPGPSVEEEWAALLTAIGAYRNSRTPGEDNREPAEPDPFMEFLVEVHDADLLQAFVVFEVLHKRYGVSLERLPGDLAGQVEQYLVRFVFPPTQSRGG